MAEQWYWKHKGNLLGPMDTAKLEDLVRHHRISDKDHIALADTNHWLTGAEVKSIFCEQSAAPSADVAARLLNDAARRQLNRSVIEVKTAGALEAMSRSTKGSVGHALALVTDSLGTLIVHVLPLFNRKVLAGLLCVLTLLWMGKELDTLYFANRHIYGQLTESFERLQQLQERPIRDVASSEWQTFQSETSHWLKPTIESLEAQSQANPASKAYWLPYKAAAAHARWNLLAAAKDLHAMTIQAAVPTARSADFVRKMEAANHYLTGAQSPNQFQRHSAAQVAPMNTATIGIVAVDTLLITGGLFYWLAWRRT